MRSILSAALLRIQSMFSDIFGMGRSAAMTAIALIVTAVATAAFLFVYLAPPDTITITTGPEGSMFYRHAERYAKILARSGVKVKIEKSEGSGDNLKKLLDPNSKIDVGFVQGGVLPKDTNVESIMSLGSMFYEPLYVFYRAGTQFETVAQFSGKRVAIGEVGSGTHILSLAILKLNGIEPGGQTQLLDLDSDEAVKGFMEGKLDAIFLMGDSVSTKTIRDLRKAPNVKLFDFTQADGYTRRIRYLSKLVLPKGVIDFGINIPPRDIMLVGPTVELIAKQDLHPALSDLLLEAAKEVHGRAGLLQKKGEFPLPIENEYNISSDASRYYKSGKGFLYRYLPYGLASLINRVLLVIVPLIIVLLPGLKMIPAVYRWRIKSRIFRWYKALMEIEKDLGLHIPADKKEGLISRLDEIEDAVNRMKVPTSFADQFYGLRGHISLVRARLVSN